MKLSGVEQSKFDTGRCTIIFENGEKLKSFTSVAADMGLYAGKELSDEDVLKLRNASRTMSAKARAARIVGAANVSKEQLVKRLCDKGESAEDAENAANWLEDMGAVNDVEFAAAIVRNCASRGYGKARARQKLREKGIPKELWDDALEQFPDNSEKIDRYVRAHLSSGEKDRKVIKKVADALMRRGFSWEEVSLSLERVLNSDIAEE